MNDAQIGIIATIIGGGIGYFLKFYLDRKKEYTTEVYKERRETYQTFVDLMLDHIGKTKTYTDENLRKEIYKFYKKSILYASPKVAKAFADFFQSLYATKENLDVKTILFLLTNIIKEMRTDLGLSNKDLGEKGELLIRPMISDYDSIMNVKS